MKIIVFGQAQNGLKRFRFRKPTQRPCSRQKPLDRRGGEQLTAVFLDRSGPLSRNTKCDIFSIAHDR